jgi:hypothetical protein
VVALGLTESKNSGILTGEKRRNLMHVFLCLFSSSGTLNSCQKKINNDGFYYNSSDSPCSSENNNA